MTGMSRGLSALSVAALVVAFWIGSIPLFSSVCPAAIWHITGT
jgi:hypothetical protein